MQPSASMQIIPSSLKGRQWQQFRDFDQANELSEALLDIHSDFISLLLANAGLRILSGPSDHARIALDCRFREDYMQRLRKVLLEAIEAGLNPTGPYFEHIMRVNSAIYAAVPAE